MWFPCPIVFRLYRCGSTSSSPRLIFARVSSSPRTVTSTTSLSYLAIAWIPTWPYFCIAYPSRLAIEYCRQRDLCTLVIILHSIHTIPSWCISWYHILCHKFGPAYTQLLSWFVHCAKVAIQKNKKRIKLLSKRKREQRSL